MTVTASRPSDAIETTDILTITLDTRSNWGISEGSWHHVAFVDNSFGVHTYIDGQRSPGTYSSGGLTIRRPDGGFYIGSGLKGYMDQFTILTGPVNKNIIQQVIGETPIHYYHLDEEAGSIVFKDSSLNPVDAVCSGDCPTAGSEGVLREAPEFDKDDELGVFGAKTDGLTRDAYSFSLWVKPNNTPDSSQFLIEQNFTTSDNDTIKVFVNSNNQVQFRQSLYDSDTDNNICVQRIWGVTSDAVIQANQWNHIVVAYEYRGSEPNPTIYQSITVNNGTPKVSESSTPAVNTNSSICDTHHPRNDLYIGNTFGNAFEGQIDEVAIYDIALGASAIDRIWDFQSSWFDTRVRPSILIDADAPEISLVKVRDMVAESESATYWPVSVVDPSGTEIVAVTAQLEYEFGTWKSHPLQTLSQSEGGAVWLYLVDTLNPRFPHRLTLTAEDAFGHVGTTVYLFDVDGEAPTGSLDGQFSNPVQPDNNTVDLFGQISDDRSGLATDSVTINVLDPHGTSVSEVTDVTLGADNSWIVSAPMDNIAYGTFDLLMSAADAVGNEATNNLGKVYVDDLGPWADILYTTKTMTPTNPTISGVVSELPMSASGLAALYHFEESTSADGFDNSGRLSVNCNLCGTLPCSWRTNFVWQWSAANG